MSTRSLLLITLLVVAAGVGCVSEADSSPTVGARTTPAGNALTGPYDRPGFITFEEDGRLWVFREGTKELEQHLLGKELAKHVTKINAGPAGMTVKAPDIETADAYLAAKPGFVTKVEDGRLWVFKAGSSDIEKHAKGMMAKHVTRIGAGPDGMSIKAPDVETIDAYITYVPGFVTKIEDGRVWVFHEGSSDIEKHAKGMMAKHVTRIGAGPNGMSIKAPDVETIDAYLAAKPGFTTFVEDGRVWVFMPGSENIEKYKKDMLAKHVTRIGAGPAGMSVKGVETDVIDRYVVARGWF